MGKRKRKRQERSWGYRWWNDPWLSRQELLQRVSPLIQQIQRVDDMVDKIARGEGRVADLVSLEQLLRAPLAESNANRRPVALAQPNEVHSMLSSVSRELHLEVHALDGRYPCYLLCRVSNDWDAPDNILEELHVSARNDFFPDERFAILMRNGRSKTFLRLSPFRKALKDYLTMARDESADERACDDMLNTVATLVLGATWYEDQRLPFIVADTFGLKQFRSALELVAFILGSDLYQIATGLEDWGDEIAAFFSHVYENTYLAQFLEQLSHSGAENLADLEEAAREAFVDLNRAFSTFLSTPNALCDLESLEPYKIVLGCFGNLREVAAKAHWTEAMENAIHLIEKSADDSINQLGSFIVARGSE
jgi:hypothetical protein